MMTPLRTGKKDTQDRTTAATLRVQRMLHDKDRWPKSLRVAARPSGTTRGTCSTDHAGLHGNDDWQGRCKFNDSVFFLLVPDDIQTTFGTKARQRVRRMTRNDTRNVAQAMKTWKRSMTRAAVHVRVMSEGLIRCPFSNSLARNGILPA